MSIPPQLVVWGGRLAIGAGAYMLHRLLSASPVQETFEKKIWSLVPNRRSAESVLVELALKHIIESEAYYSQMMELGYDSNKANYILKSGEMWADSRSVIVAGWREGLSDDVIITKLENRGWKEGEADCLMTASRYYPSPAELVRWQAREVFEKDMVTKYGLDDEYGKLELSSFYKAGMDDEQIKNFWRAHWEHASWTQVQQMLFRRLIDEKDVWDWFKLVEIPPFWRQHMIDSAYHPLTRVDVRRMHRVKTLSDEDLVWAYMDVGFNKKNAGLMADFTIAYNATPEDSEATNLTRAQVETAYRIGFIGRGEAEGFFEDMDYAKEEVEFILALIDHGKSLESGSSWITILRSQVKSGLITVQDAGNRLAELGFSSEAVSAYTELFAAYAEVADRLPSKTDVKNWFGLGYITDKDTRSYLKAMGHCARDIDLYMRWWTPAPA